MKRFLAIISIVLVGIFLLQGCGKGKGFLNKISDIEMTLPEGESNVSVNLLDYVSIPKGKDVDINTLDISVVEQGDYGTFVVTGEILTYLRTVQTDANDTGVLEVTDGTNSVLINVTVITEGTPGEAVWKLVSAGMYHSVGLKSDGTIWSWGDNINGQLGDGTTTDSSVPVQESTKATNWIAIDAGRDFTVALKSDHTLWSWGGNSNVPVQESTGASDWISVSAGGQHTVAIKSDGTIWSWGANQSGQLGDGSTTSSTVPVQEFNHDEDWISVSAGDAHTAAIKSNGELWTWGLNFSGQLGNGTTNNSSVPVQESTGASDWISVGAGSGHTTAFKSNGEIWSWGANSSGQLGDGTTDNSSVPVQEINHDTNWTSVNAGASYTVAIKSDGTLLSWGSNYFGQLGDGTTTDSYEPVQESTESSDWLVVSGSYHTLAIKSDGTLWSWGNNNNGQLGDGTTNNSSVPAQVQTTEVQ